MLNASGRKINKGFVNPDVNPDNNNPEKGSIGSYSSLFCSQQIFFDQQLFKPQLSKQEWPAYLSTVTAQGNDAHG